MNWFVAFPLCVATAGFIVAIAGSIDGDVPLAVYGIGISVIFSVFAMAAMEIFK